MTKHFPLPLRIYFLLICCIGIANSTSAQDLTGTWTGSLEQEPNKQFKFEIHIDKQVKDSVYGTTYIRHWTNERVYGTISFKGQFNGYDLRFTESEVIKQEKLSSNFYWCIKQGKLSFIKQDSVWKLEGKWSADVCQPGNLTVTKAPPTKEEAPLITRLENRNVRTDKTIEVQNKAITIALWDDNKQDGDIISINVNGNWELRNFPLTVQKRLLQVELGYEENYLVLHAENLGRIPPNTAAITVNDGITEQKIVLNSDNGMSEGILIRLVE